MPSQYEAQLISASYTAEIASVEYEIRHAQKEYYHITKRGPLSDHDCAELDAIDAYIATKKREVKELLARAAAAVAGGAKH